MIPYTPEQLTAMAARELDAVVATEVLGQALESRDWNLPPFSTAWSGMGLILDQMKQLSITLDMTQTSGDKCYVAAFIGATHDKCIAETYAPSLPQAVAIAAVLACQSGAV